MVAAGSLKNAAINASLAQLFLYGLLFLQLTPAVEAGSLKNFCKSLKCWSKEDVSAPKWQPKPYDYAELKCPNPNAPKDETGWNIYKNAVPMPKVDDIVKDLQLCGILNDKTSTVFYSFGGGKTNARKFIEKYPELNGKTINDALPTSWYKALGRVPGINAYGTLAQMAWIARTSQALARASSGDTYVVTGSGTNIYTVPYKAQGELAWRGEHNVWYDYEFATLQNNKAVKAIYSVDADSLTIDKSPKGSWVRDRTPQGDKAEFHMDADKVTEQSLKAQKEAYEAEEACNQNPDAITPAPPKNSKRANSSGAASASKPTATSSQGAACSRKPKSSSSGSTSSTSSASNKSSETAKPSETGKSTGTAKPTGSAKPTDSAQPTTLVTKTSSAKDNKTTSSAKDGKTTNKPEPPKTTNKPEPPKSTDKPEPPKTSNAPKPSETSKPNKPCKPGKKCP